MPTLSTTRYRKPDGTLSASRADAILIDPSTVEQIAGNSSAVIAPPFVSGIARRETGLAVNEEDTDKNADGTVKAATFGLLQITKAEQARTGIAGDLNDPAVNIAVFCKLMESNLGEIAQAAGFSTVSIPADAWKYLAWSHNNGIGAVLKSIRTYGMDWNALKARPQNDYMTQKLIPYAEAATSGISSSTGSLVVGLLIAVGIGLLVWRYV